ncbi:hypothetical protein [Evansella halocellulosilytica]|uniref:hypothetical protein n=1 Tax=Evansella halocellulosilytica TaxID=2011013 RepID=UPI00387EBEE2
MKETDAPFSYQINKYNTVFIKYYGKQVKISNVKDAKKILKKMSGAENEKASQLIIAKITGNFKRGNEQN